jgi:hypothetical protein
MATATWVVLHYFGVIRCQGRCWSPVFAMSMARVRAGRAADGNFQVGGGLVCLLTSYTVALLLSPLFAMCMTRVKLTVRC